MKPIKIRVAHQLNGYTFSILPSDQLRVTTLLPNAFPASRIFVAYPIQSDFMPYFNRVETHVLPALLGLENKDDLFKLGEIQLWDTTHEKLLHQINQIHEQTV